MPRQRPWEPRDRRLQIFSKIHKYHPSNSKKLCSQWSVSLFGRPYFCSGGRLTIRGVRITVQGSVFLFGRPHYHPGHLHHCSGGRMTIRGVCIIVRDAVLPSVTTYPCTYTPGRTPRTYSRAFPRDVPSDLPPDVPPAAHKCIIFEVRV